MMIRRLALIVSLLLAFSASAATPPVLDSTAVSGSNWQNAPFGTAGCCTFTTVTSSAVTTSAAVELVVITVSMKNAPVSSTVTASGGSFSTSPTLAVRLQSSGPPGLVEIWYAITSSALSAVTFTATANAAFDSAFIGVFPFSSSSLTLGNTASQLFPGGAFANVTITTSANSMVLMSPVVFTTGFTTMLSNTALFTNGNDSERETAFKSVNATTAGSQTYGASAGDTTSWEVVALEVRGAPSDPVAPVPSRYRAIRVPGP